ncbi:MAG: adenosylcobinamide-phosphate synthase CbiB, partial [Spongiibacteraceae bacterium]
MMMTVITVIVVALLLDQLLGEPRRWHPLVGFGWLANRFEKMLNRGAQKARYVSGVTAWIGIVSIPVLLAVGLQYVFAKLPWPFTVIGEALVVYLAIGRKSLIDHARAVANALTANDLNQARHAVSMIVTRDTRALDASDVSKAAVETVLENGSDAIFASLFWFAVAGLPGVVLHRAANTLDAMWGYRNARFNEFGCAAARIDDVLNLIPARLTAIAYALSGQCANALRSWRVQASSWSSPNAGPVMAAGAGALGLQLGGAAMYHGAM